MDRLERMDRRARYSVGGALAFLGVLLLVLGWYLISGQAVAAKQLPYLASASLPGAVLVVCGFLFAVTGASERDVEAARRIAELHALLTEAVAAPPGAGEDPEPVGAVESSSTVEPSDYVRDSETSETAEASETAEPRESPRPQSPAGPGNS